MEEMDDEIIDYLAENAAMECDSGNKDSIYWED